VENGFLDQSTGARLGSQGSPNRRSGSGFNGHGRNRQENRAG
jgi:hypothetical protein